jgi:hypothetical protein
MKAPLTAAAASWGLSTTSGLKRSRVFSVSRNMMSSPLAEVREVERSLIVSDIHIEGYSLTAEAVNPIFTTAACIMNLQMLFSTP